MSKQALVEKYFVFNENEGTIEAVYWCQSLEEAKEVSKNRKKRFPEEAESVHIGEVLN